MNSSLIGSSDSSSPIPRPDAATLERFRAFRNELRRPVDPFPQPVPDRAAVPGNPGLAALRQHWQAIKPDRVPLFEVRLGFPAIVMPNDRPARRRRKLTASAKLRARVKQLRRELERHAEMIAEALEGKAVSCGS